MTFAELVFLIAVGVLVFRLLAPIRRHIEFQLYKFFRAKMKTKTKPIIDITDYRKAKDPKNEI